MDHVVYFTDKKAAFLDENAPTDEFDAVIRDDEHFSPTKVIHFLEKCNRVAVLSARPERAFERFAAGFIRVEAAGGAVFTPDGRLLMMRRRGKYDLPKGHLEQGESLEECAVREVLEETGVAARIDGHICDTMHAYTIFGRRELKRTHWYMMSSDSAAATTPQHEEGIESVEWITPQRLGECLADTYPTIRCVAESPEVKARLAPFLLHDAACNK